MKTQNSSLLEDKLSKLNPEERAYAIKILSDVANGDDSSFKSLINADYRELPVGPEEFLDNPYYFHHIAKSMYKLWRKHFIEIYGGSLDVYHIILTGSIGCGKDYFAEVCLAYELYKIGCLKDPHSYFGLAVNSDIVFALVSVTKAQAKNVIFTDFKNMIDSSPWFKDHFRRNMDKNDIIEIKTPKDDGEFSEMGKIIVMYGAPNNTSIIGANVLTAVIDEANFMEVVQKSKRSRGVNKEFNQAQGLYGNILRRAESRYKEDGKIPGKLILISSRQYPDDFVEKKIRELRGKPGVVIFEHTKYEMTPEKFSKEKFKVEIGDERFPSRLLEEGLVPRDGADVIEVPIDFLEAFQLDVDGAVRDIAGRPALSVKNFIGLRDRLYACVKPEVPCLFTGTTTTLADGHTLLLDKLSTIDLTAPRAIHLDLSTTKDATGFTMTHVCGMHKVDRLIEIETSDGCKMEKVSEYLPAFRTDLMLQIVPPPNSEILQSAIRSLIYKLRDLGFNIVVISADKYQSKGMLQTFRENGFNTEELSVDLSLEPYYNLRNAIYEGRFECYDHPVFLKEMTYLEEDTKRKKIDHPASGPGKDVADSVAGSVQSLINLGIMSSSILTKESPSLGYIVKGESERTIEDDTDEFDNEVFTEVMLGRG